uniref:Sec1 family protein n=1 Tax=viral metagenome TaxID=1070528 RepID=A0A6C0C6K2_9ZZZZ
MNDKFGIKSTLIAKACNEILRVFESIPEKKIVLIVDRILAQLIHVAIDFQTNKIKKLGVISTYYLDDKNITFEKNVVYFVSNKNRKIDSIISQMSQFPNHKYYIYFAPKCSIYHDGIFEENGLAGKYTKGKLSECCLLPIDFDILSMEIPLNVNFVDIKNYIPNVVHVLNNMGHISNIHCVGETAKVVGSLLEKSKDNYATFDDMIIIDRQCDLVTPLLSQKTYRGMISDCMQTTYQELVHEHLQKLKENPLNKTNMKVSNNMDNVYNEIKDMYFYDIGAHLAKIVREIEQARNKNDNPSIQDLSGIVSCLKKYPKDVVEFNINLCTKVIAIYKADKDVHILEDDILEGKNKQFISDIRDPQMLRLLCLMSHCSNDSFNFFDFKHDKKNFLAYERMHHANLLRQKEIAQYTLPNIVTKILQKKSLANKFETSHIDNSVDNKSNKILIFVIGGITYDEIHDINELQTSYPTKKIYIASTNVINKNTFIDAFMK